MNLHTSACSPESEEWILLQNGQASEQLDNVKKIPIVSKSWKDTFHKSQNSMISETCQLTLSGMPALNARPYCPEVSRVSPSVLPGSKEARKMTAISGRKCLELCRSSGHLGLLERMCLESLEWHSMIFSMNWNIINTPQERSYFRLRLSEPCTAGIDVSLWPTPMTPRPHDSENTAGKYYPSQGQKDLVYAVHMWATPSASDAVGSHGGGQGRSLRTDIWKWKRERERERESLANSMQQRPQRHGRFIHDGKKSGEWSSWRGCRPLEGLWVTEPAVGRVANGIPSRVDRLRALGNAVVPQQVFPIFRAIACIEKEHCQNTLNEVKNE